MNVAPELKPHLRRMDSLIPLPGNARQGDIGAISESLVRFGQLKPIVVDADGVILAGNHTFHAAVALGWTEMAVVESGLKGQEKNAFALADNRLSDLASYDSELLLAMIESVDDLAGTGYDLDDADLIRADIEAPLQFLPEATSDQARLDQLSSCHRPDCTHLSS